MPTYLDVDFAQPEGYRPLSLDLRTPEIDGAPLIVFLHGGGFRRGSRKVFTPGIPRRGLVRPDRRGGFRPGIVRIPAERRGAIPGPAR